MKHETQKKDSQNASSFKLQASRHAPVLLNEVIRFLDPKEGDFIVDGTVDGGGHAAEILNKVLPSGKLLGVDSDVAILERARERISANSKSSRHRFKNFNDGGIPQGTGQIPNHKLILEYGNYANLPEILKNKNLGLADGLLLDLGFSSEQLEGSGRGFSFLKDEQLLMTYNDEREPVRNILRRLTEKEIADVIFKFGGERYSRRIAKAVKERSKKTLIRTSGELAEIVRNALPKNYERGRINPATRTFQALRIYANDELGNLKKILNELASVLSPGGRAVVISFHSLEDKIVKDAFKEMAGAGTGEILTKKPVMASEEELKNNPRARSAKLRAIRLTTNNN